MMPKKGYGKIDKTTILSQKGKSLSYNRNTRDKKNDQLVQVGQLLLKELVFH